MQRENVFAFTAEGSPYPEYVSVNQESDDSLTITVREPAKPGPYSDKDCGATVSMTLPWYQMTRLLDALKQYDAKRMLRLAM